MILAWGYGSCSKRPMDKEAARTGKTSYVIMNQTGHKSVEMVMRYVREVELFEDNAAVGLRL